MGQQLGHVGLDRERGVERRFRHLEVAELEMRQSLADHGIRNGRG